jgi:hypothetical protein
LDFFRVGPEVAGEIGSGSVVDMATRPPAVKKLQYLFHGWLGDCILESIAVYIVTQKAAADLEASGLTGYTLQDVDTVVSEEFIELQPETMLPEFRWLRIHETAGVDDFFMSRGIDLIVSSAALSILQGQGLQHAEIKSWQASV